MSQIMTNAGMNNPVLKVSNLKKAYGAIQAVDRKSVV